ncbi:helix-hairpin-helix domain-containing protein [Xylophilus sp. GOD-11R]|uniref:ComEA family DNA-binding protein n=1 Tax=Xylophilus sp. GOD-11R TaxID=3089814 RepID=UPI00298CCC1A|nr:helix-hairpin-helix domain-containing protein [Xylophilus sp. GOD-11R]WPB57881.1 helix-hairpin-helix domain-containing protein [Xylophilus sp. GOD-11R]
MLKKLVAMFAMLIAASAFAAVDVNKASTAELDGVKGVGPVTSRLILAEREKGAFKNWEDFVSRVKGVGESRASKLSANGLTVDGAAFTAPVKSGKPATEKVKDGARAAADKTKEVAKEAKDKVAGK